MKRKIIFVNQSAGYLMVDIVNQLAAQYEECILMTGFLNPRNNQLKEKVVVEKIIAYERKTTWRRLFTWGWGSLQIFFSLFFRHRKADLFIVSNPPFAPLLTIGLTNDFSLLIYDVYPDALVEYKILKEHSLPAKLWKWANKKVFAKADRIFTITEGMKDRLAQYTNSYQSIEVVPVWTDNSFFKPIAKQDNSFLQNQGLQDRFVVLYSGNLGYTHSVETLVELAAHTSRTELFFLIIGEGKKEYSIKKKIQEYGLKNCRWLSWQPTEILPLSLASADLAVVTLGKEASKLSIPSKTFNYLSVGAPILSIADSSSELSQLVENYKVGANFSPDDLKGMQLFIDRLIDKPEYYSQLRTNALQTASAYSPNNARLFLENTDYPPYDIQKRHKNTG